MSNPIPLRCPGRVHGTIVDHHLVRIRCKDPRCPDVRMAKASGAMVFHLFDSATGTLERTEFVQEVRQDAA